MGARWYRPGTGTFTSRDPATLDPRDLDNANRHTYAAANPLTNTDPTGNTTMRHDGGALYGGARMAIDGARLLEEIFGKHPKPKTAPPPSRPGTYGSNRADAAGRYDSVGTKWISGSISNGDNGSSSGGSKSRRSSNGGSGGSAASWFDPRGAWVTANALRPAPRPPATVEVAAHIQPMIDAANNAEGIDLGTLRSGSGGEPATYTPESTPSTAGSPTSLGEFPLGSVAVDADVLIRAINNGEAAAVDAIFAGRAPIVSPKAAAQFLEYGDADDLYRFLQQRRGGMGSAASDETREKRALLLAAYNQQVIVKPSGKQVPVQERRIGSDDFEVAAAALEMGLTLVTRDKRLYNTLIALGIRAERYVGNP